MIDITYDRDANQTRVELKHFTIFKKNELPLTAQFKRTIDGLVGWSAELEEGTWATWSGGETQYDVVIKTADGSPILYWKFDVERDGDLIEKAFFQFIKNSPTRCKGMVIGSHNGLFGHWVFPVVKNMSDVVIVDGSEPQFMEVVNNYSHIRNAKFINEIITVDGADVDWMEGGEGFTDTICKSVITKHVEEDKIKHTERSSTSINELFEKEGPHFDWLHLDVEGLDADLILALKYEPTVIIFETMHIPSVKYSALLDWFQEKGYKLFNDGFNAMAIKK